MHALILFALVAVQPGRPLTPLPAPQYLDGETAASNVTDQQIPSQSSYGFELSFTGTPSNNLELVLGTGSDMENGALVGWDCGRYFVERKADGVRWWFGADSNRTDRTLRYTCATRKTRLNSITIEADGQELKPEIADIELRMKKHELYWEFTAHNRVRHVGNLVDLTLSPDLKGRRLPGEDVDPYGAALGVPDCLFDRPTSYEQPNYYVVDDPHGVQVDGVGPYGNYGYHRLRTYVYGSGPLSFDWKMKRVPSWIAPEFDFYVDGVCVASIHNSTGGWEHVAYTIPVSSFVIPVSGKEWDYASGLTSIADTTPHTITWHVWTDWYSDEYSFDLSDFRYEKGILMDGTSGRQDISRALRCPELVCQQYGDSNWNWQKTARNGLHLTASHEYQTTHTYLTAFVKGSGVFAFDYAGSKPNRYSFPAEVLVDGKVAKDLRPAGVYDPRGTATVFIPPPEGNTGWMWAKEFDTLRVTSRGLPAAAQPGTYHIDQSGGLLMLR